MASINKLSHILIISQHRQKAEVPFQVTHRYFVGEERHLFVGELFLFQHLVLLQHLVLQAVDLRGELLQPLASLLRQPGASNKIRLKWTEFVAPVRATCKHVMACQSVATRQDNMTSLSTALQLIRNHVRAYIINWAACTVPDQGTNTKMFKISYQINRAVQKDVNRLEPNK